MVKRRNAKVAANAPADLGTVPAIAWTGDGPMSREFVADIRALEEYLQMPVWLLLQDGSGDNWGFLDESISKSFYNARRDGLLPGNRIALVIDSDGGLAEDAFEIARLLQRHCKGFVAVVPRHAKSAATLLALGADSIVLGEFVELGPLDVQIFDSERETWISGLDEVQALERLHAFVLSSLDQTMFTMMARTGRKVATVLPHVTKLITDMTRPLFEKVDVVRYAQMSRALKVGEEYTKRLLARKLAKPEADRVARNLVENYPTHSFVIDVDEARQLGLQIAASDDRQTAIVDRIAERCGGISAVGPLIAKGVSP